MSSPPIDYSDPRAVLARHSDLVRRLRHALASTRVSTARLKEMGHELYPRAAATCARDAAYLQKLETENARLRAYLFPPAYHAEIVVTATLAEGIQVVPGRPLLRI